MPNESFKEKLERELDELLRKKKLLEIYPDIRESTGRWGDVRLISQHVNELVDDVDICHSCGCCEDAPVQAWPFKVVNGVKVFSDPSKFVIGEKVPSYSGMGDRPYDNWQEELEKAGITQIVISKIQKYFKDNTPKHIEYIDDEEF